MGDGGTEEGGSLRVCVCIHGGEMGEREGRNGVACFVCFFCSGRRRHNRGEKQESQLLLKLQNI